MKAAITVPPLMRDLPRDPRGLPITFTSIKMPDGRYDFTRADMVKWLECVVGRTCGLCGKTLPKRIWFIGGPLSMTNRIFFDLAMHEDCARYALLVCPYLAVKSYTQAKKRNIAEGDGILSRELESSNSTKPAVFGLAVTDGYTPIRFQGDALVQAKRWIREIEWWDAGQRVEFDYAGFTQRLRKVSV